MNLEEHILKKVKSEPSEWHKPKLGFYHASQIYDIVEGKLKPEDFFKKSDFDDNTLMIFEIGKMYHSYVSSYFEKEAQDLPIEIDVGNGAKIVGRMDLFVGGAPIELKSCSRMPSKPYAYNVYQTQCYSKATDKQWGWLVYIQKDPKRLITKNFKVLRDDKLIAHIQEKVGEFHEKLKTIKQPK